MGQRLKRSESPGKLVATTRAEAAPPANANYKSVSKPGVNA
jgi:hypothetical protein